MGGVFLATSGIEAGAQTRNINWARSGNATGKPTIQGTAQVGQTLTAQTDGIGDPDGIAGVTFNYNWILVRGTREDTLAGEESSTYTLGHLDLGAKIKAKVWFQDDGDGIEAVVSDATATVTAAPAGAPTLTMPLHLETIFVDENITTTTAVYTYQATDSDGDTVTYSIPAGVAGGADGSKFSINSSSGVLTFKASLDYENPTDANTDNQYEPQFWIRSGEGWEVGQGAGEADFTHFDLGLCQGVSRQAGENMDKGVDGGSVAGVLQSHAGFELIKESFYDASFAQEYLVQ